LMLESAELSALRGENTDAGRKHRSALLRLAIARELLLLQGGSIELNALREAGGRIDDASRVRIASLPRLVVRGTTAAVSGRRFM